MDEMQDSGVIVDSGDVSHWARIVVSAQSTPSTQEALLSRQYSGTLGNQRPQLSHRGSVTEGKVERTAVDTFDHHREHVGIEKKLKFAPLHAHLTSLTIQN